MTQFHAHGIKVATGGPYMYVLVKEGVGVKAATNLATVGAALDAAKNDIAANLNGEQVVEFNLYAETK